MDSPDDLRFNVCLDQSCLLRFPGRSESRCPLCGAETVVAAPRLRRPFVVASKSRRGPLIVLLDNIRSAYNVGSIFRSADGAGVSRIYLGGISPTPSHLSFRKTALGADKSIAWSHHNNSVHLAQSLIENHHVLWALEQTEESQDIFCAGTRRPEKPLVIVLGNEVTGIDPGLLALCEAKIQIPMFGSKESLNVACAFAIAAYALG